MRPEDRLNRRMLWSNRPASLLIACIWRNSGLGLGFVWEWRQPGAGLEPATARMTRCVLFVLFWAVVCDFPSRRRLVETPTARRAGRAMSDGYGGWWVFVWKCWSVKVRVGRDGSFPL